ncbi:hypothetical protein TW95_gp1628 [Pandoravirus inopinatum]|uniref:Uncharacterized protein n=1 Tax=Pandoravirus inopinatum TaxID=1605721 RepID=A0A0B5JEX2_9VIRU|nr:hypothetical protein TW95_gp1628 [Pandoravirus inopinatum]AJF98362.1 hypothetical protein [Pandoravirus inopinatum]
MTAVAPVWLAVLIHGPSPFRLWAPTAGHATASVPGPRLFPCADPLPPHVAPLFSFLSVAPSAPPNTGPFFFNKEKKPFLNPLFVFRAGALSLCAAETPGSSPTCRALFCRWTRRDVLASQTKNIFF